MSADATLIDDIDSEERRAFLPAQWIGQQKQYQKELPLHVIDARIRAAELPPIIQQQIPREDLPIASLVNIAFPKMSKTFSVYPTSAWFSHQEPDIGEPTMILRHVLKRTIPPKTILNTLYNEFGQYWLDGFKSIVDPRYKTKESMPLYTLTLWRSISNILEGQEQWKSILARVQSQLDNSPSLRSRFKSVDNIIGSIGWSSTFRIVSNRNTYNVRAFAPLLQDAMLGDDITEAMVTTIQSRLRDHQVYQKTHFVPASRFHLVLKKAAEEKRFNLDALREIDGMVKRCPDLLLWMAVLHNMHEVVIQVDFGKRTIAIGESAKYTRGDDGLTCLWCR